MNVRFIRLTGQASYLAGSPFRGAEFAEYAEYKGV